MKTTLKLIVLMLAIALYAGETNAQTTTTNETNNFKITTPNGYLQIGPMNSSWSHFQTDRDKFYFNKPVYINGSIHSYIGKNLSIGTHGQSQLTILESNGNVGIGTTSPIALLSVQAAYGTSNFPTISSKGDILGFLVSGNNGIEFGSARASNERKSWILARHSSSSYGKHYSILHLQPDIGDVSKYKGVAIGYKPNAHITSGFYLSVNGKIESEEIKVQNVTGADFVFAPDYNLMPLTEIETYIKANHHLPEVPSAAQMKANGVELGKMNMLLLQKIEELTLHQIEMNRLLREQQKQLKVQNQKITNLENKLK